MNDKKDKKTRYMPEEVTMSVIFAFLLFFGGINVVLRYFFNTQIPYVNDMMVDVFVWLCLIGLPVACYRGANMSFTLLYDSISPKWQIAFTVFNYLLGIALFAFIGYCGTVSMLTQFSFGYKTAVPFIPKWVWSTGFPIGCGLYIIRSAQCLWKAVQEHRKSAKKEASE
ncbi:TRAP transporter small permease [Agathobaculum sp. NTUH-O15-33]|uniref:TRAP transporter small permease n=1 Tax=Agathobaculum sp. NTUH-O15-33 TaxID=3079302 RepID=UPI0029589541|nr:TRAP transporter small permease [Agathobaculum sp. NTUH-O15-33]WNX85721.1 TRAP transporter small permease [Agathobaculum sp. NTUH-O15-33]